MFFSFQEKRESKLEKREKIKNEFVHETNDTEKQRGACFICESIRGIMSCW